MIIEYNEDISKQQFIASAEELKALKIEIPSGQDYFLIGEIDNPVVALDIPKLIKLPNGRLIKHLFVESNNPVGTMYDDVNTYWFKLPGTWPATIDSLVHLKGQKKANIPKSRAPFLSVLDLGCGTGIAGKGFVKQHPNVAYLDVADIQRENIETAMKNLPTNCQFVSNGFDGIPKWNKYNIILASAIPATPIYKGREEPVNSLFEGTSFLEGILRDSSSHLEEGGRLILSHASMGESITVELAKKYGAKVRELYRHEVAFREDFLKDRKEVDYLKEIGGFKEEEKDGHKFWYDVIVKEISFE
jgi:hypothetical protein